MKRLIFLCLTLGLCLCSCGGQTSSTLLSSQAPPPPPASSALPEPEPTMARNPLTGLMTMEPSAVGKRPAACMVSNMKEALPQYGVGQADLIYEAVCEGGITRMVAVFADINAMPRTGPVRSARNYYIDFALGHDAVLAHFGTSNLAAAKIKSEKIKTLDGMTSSAFWRDQAIRKAKGLEHSAFTEGVRLREEMVKKNYPTDLEQVQDAFLFAQTPYTPSAQSCQTARVPFSGYCQGVFTYNSEKKTYAKEEFQKPQIDALTGETVSVTNVFVLFDSVSQVGDEAGHLKMALKSGEGYYISMGGAMPIHWEKGKSASPFVYTDSNGEPLAVNPGKSWICLVSKGQKSKVSLM